MQFKVRMLINMKINLSIAFPTTLATSIMGCCNDTSCFSRPGNKSPCTIQYTSPLNMYQRFHHSWRGYSAHWDPRPCILHTCIDCILQVQSGVSTTPSRLFLSKPCIHKCTYSKFSLVAFLRNSHRCMRYSKFKGIDKQNKDFLRWYGWISAVEERLRQLFIILNYPFNSMLI